MILDLDKLAAFGGASAAGALVCVTCWAWRSLAARTVRRPYANAFVHSSLGLTFGLGASLSVELYWECNVAGKVLAGLVAGALIGLFGPRWAVEMAVRLAAEYQSYREWNRERLNHGLRPRANDNSDSCDDTDTEDRRPST